MIEKMKVGKYIGIRTTKIVTLGPLFGLVLIDKLPKSLLSALFYLISKSAPSE